MADPTDGNLDVHSLAVFFFLIAGALFNYALIARWYVWPALCARPLETALQPLLQFAAFRYLGAVTLTPPQVAGNLPQGWAWSAAVGDVSSAALALLALCAVRAKWSSASLLVWVYVIYGSIALIVSFIGAMKYQVPEKAGSFLYIIVTLLIPAAILVIVMLVGLMRSGKSLQTSSS